MTSPQSSEVLWEIIPVRPKGRGIYPIEIKTVKENGFLTGNQKEF